MQIHTNFNSRILALGKVVVFATLLIIQSFVCAAPFHKPTTAELHKMLTSEQYNVTQENATEIPFKNAYWDNHAAGIYVDLVSGEPLFSSLQKYDSGTGWPSFWQPLVKENIVERVDNSMPTESRTEVRSKLADSHLGHVFTDGPKPTGLRYCMNSAALKFIPVAKLSESGYGEYLPLFNTQQSIVFAGGCFWGVQAVFEHVKGVISATSGYAGGAVANPTYDLVSTGTTNHAESVKVIYNPNQVSLDTLLKVFFSVVHDPTELNYQGPDQGTQYRSAIFFTNEAQQKVIQSYINKLTDQKTYNKPIVTQVKALEIFYPAEAYHQNFYDKHPLQPYILQYDRPKVEKLHKQFPQLWINK